VRGKKTTPQRASFCYIFDKRFAVFAVVSNGAKAAFAGRFEIMSKPLLKALSKCRAAGQRA
jgi:hypothetical protein